MSEMPSGTRRSGIGLCDASPPPLPLTRHHSTHPRSTDWDVAILHFLGVDHVGHMDGPGSPTMARKLEELDRVLVSLLENVRAQDDLRGSGSCSLVVLVR